MTPKPPPVWPFPTWRGRPYERQAPALPYTPPKAKPQRKTRRAPEGPEGLF